MRFTTAPPRRGNRAALPITFLKCKSAFVRQACPRNMPRGLLMGGRTQPPPAYGDLPQFLTNFGIWGRCHVVTRGLGGNIYNITIVLRVKSTYICEGDT